MAAFFPARKRSSHTLAVQGRLLHCTNIYFNVADDPSTLANLATTSLCLLLAHHSSLTSSCDGSGVGMINGIGLAPGGKSQDSQANSWTFNIKFTCKTHSKSGTIRLSLNAGREQLQWTPFEIVTSVE